jgi:large subunit ribosomal protein L9
MPMRVILTEDVPKLGNAGEVVKVRDGFARNYLMPRGIALLATESRVREIEHKKRVIEEKVRKEVKGHEKIAQQLHKVHLEFTMLAGEEGKLFGSVTSSDIHEKLTAAGIEVDKRRIELSEPIKSLGDHKVEIRLHRHVKAEIKVTVVTAAPPAGAQPAAPAPAPAE